MSEDRTAASLRSHLAILIVTTLITLCAVLFVATRESAGVRAEAAVQGYAAALGAYQTTLADANARIRILELQSDSFRRDLWKGKWPDVDENILTRLQEMTDERVHGTDLHETAP